MIYSWCIFMHCYSAYSPLQAYFLPTHRNGEVSILGKLTYPEFQLYIPGTPKKWDAKCNTTRITSCVVRDQWRDKPLNGHV
jgi:hypothetical protein